MKRILFSIILPFITLLALPAHATRLYQTGFEWQSIYTEVSAPAGTGEAINTTTKHSGAASMRVTGSLAASAFMGVGHNMTMATDVYMRWYVYIHALPSDSGASVAVLDLWSSGAAANAFTVQIWNNAGSYIATMYYNNFATELSNTAAFSVDTWYYIDVFYKSSAAAGSDQITVKVNGTQVANSTSLTLTSTPGYWQAGVYNGSAGTITTEDVYFDDIGVNNTSGTINNSYLGEGNIVIALPNGNGASDCSSGSGDYANVNEVPPSDTATAGGSDICELDANPTNAYFAMTDSSTLGIDSYDTISAIWVAVRVREETAGTSNYTARITSASGGTPTVSTSRDAGDATTVRTNPNGTTNFGQILISETDPTTTVAWTPTGTNSIDNMQCGAGTTDGSPDTWVTTVGCMVEYVNGSAPSATRIIITE